MMTAKGRPGYLRARKSRYLFLTLLWIGVAAAVLAAGMFLNGMGLHWLLPAALGCLLALWMFLKAAAVFPYKTIPRNTAAEIESRAKFLTTAYDIVIKSRRKKIPVDAAVISQNTVFGYAASPKTDLELAARCMKDALSENGFHKLTVKVFHDYPAFLSRVDGLANMRAVDKRDSKEREMRILQVILDISV